MYYSFSTRLTWVSAATTHATCASLHSSSVQVGESGYTCNKTRRQSNCPYVYKKKLNPKLTSVVVTYGASVMDAHSPRDLTG